MKGSAIETTARRSLEGFFGLFLIVPCLFVLPVNFFIGFDLLDLAFTKFYQQAHRFIEQ